MSVDSLSLESLKAYPPWLVAMCAGVLLAAVMVLLAKPLKWGMYLLLALIYLVVMVGVLLWLGAI